MLSALSPNSLERNSLEQMLHSLRRRDENEKPKDIPPDLPARPKPMPRARLLSVKRPLPSSLEIGENGDRKSKRINKSTNHRRRNIFGGQNDMEIEPNESPYVEVLDEKESEPLKKQNDVANVILPLVLRRHVWSTRTMTILVILSTSVEKGSLQICVGGHLILEC